VLWEKPAPTMFGGQQSVWTPVPVDPSAAAEFDDFEDWVEFYGALKSQVSISSVVGGPCRSTYIVCGRAVVRGA